MPEDNQRPIDSVEEEYIEPSEFFVPEKIFRQF